MVTGSLYEGYARSSPSCLPWAIRKGIKGGVLVPLDNGTLRGSAAPLDMSAIPPDEETAPAGKDTPETAAPAADPAVSAEKPAQAPMGEIAPADTFTEKPKQPVAEEKAPQQEKKAEKAVAEKPAEKPRPEGFRTEAGKGTGEGRRGGVCPPRPPRSWRRGRPRSPRPGSSWARV